MSSRVKLNRVALKDAGDLQLAPRRRRIPQQFQTAPEDPRSQTDKASEPAPVGDAASKHSAQALGDEKKLAATSHDDEKSAATSQQSSKNREDSLFRVGATDLTTSPRRDRNAHPIPSRLTGSEAPLRRAVRVPCCDLDCDCESILPQRKPWGKQSKKQTEPVESGQPTVIEAPKEILEQRDRHLKVTLCDIAKTSDPVSHSGYVLTEAFKSKAVHCFKQDMRAGFWLKPSSLVQNKHGSDDNPHTRNSKLSPRIHSDSDADSHSSQTETHLNEHMAKEDAETLSSRTTCLSLRDRLGEAPEEPSAFCLIGQHAMTEECKTDFKAKDKASSDPECDFAEAEVCEDKKLRLEDGRLAFTPNLESSGGNDTAGTVESGTSSSTCLQAKGNGNPKTPRSDMSCHPNEEAATLLTSVSQTSMDKAEFATCQRARVYIGKVVSCARTYMPWPFQNKYKNLAATEMPNGPSSSGNGNYLLNVTQDNSPGAPVTATHGVTNKILQREKSGSICEGKEDETTKEGLGDPSSLVSPREGILVPPFSSKNTIPTVSRLKPDSDTMSAYSSPLNGPESDSAASASSPTLLRASEWDTVATPLTSVFSKGGLHSFSAKLSHSPLSLFLLDQNKAGARCTYTSPTLSLSSLLSTPTEPFFHSDKAPHTPCSPSFAAPSLTSESFESSQSSFLFPQEVPEDDRQIHRGCSPPELDYYKQSHIISLDQDLTVETRSLSSSQGEVFIESNFNDNCLPPLLSPIASPQRLSETFCPQEKEMNKATIKHKAFSAHRRAQSVYDGSKICRNVQLDRASSDCEFRTDDVAPREHLSSPSSDASKDDITDCEVDEGQGTRKGPEIKGWHPSGLLTELCSSPGCGCNDDNDDSGDVVCELRENGLGSSDEVESDGYTSEPGTSRNQQAILDEYTAYEQDILLVDVFQDDVALFDNLPQESLMKMGPIRFTEKTSGGSVVQRVTPVKMDFYMDNPDYAEESVRRPWRPQHSSSPTRIQKYTVEQTTITDQSDVNNNYLRGGLDRNKIQPIRTLTSLQKPLPPCVTRGGEWNPNQEIMTGYRHPRSRYCRLYFNESQMCGYKACRFQHVAADGDEQFCIEMVMRFTNSTCLQRAGAVFRSYYQRNKPGVYFSSQVLLSLLWALLRAGMVPDVYSVLDVSLFNKIVPSHEFLLALFHHVRERGLTSLVPELMQLTYRMANAGLVLSLDCFDLVKNTPEFQQPRSAISTSGKHKLSASSSAPLPDYLSHAHAIVELELCAKQEDWKQMGEVFKSICKSKQALTQLEQVSGRITIALLSESKDKLSVPFAAFAESIFQNESEDPLMKSFLGRIGVSLMLRYHKTHQWAKGQRVVQLLSYLKINYSTFKGLFGNEDGASRCYLVTVATELFLFRDSVEGALKTLRENDWFLSSHSWPCEPADLEGRSQVLLCLAKRTSHRDTLEVLGNLPGVKEPSDLVDISRYVPLFNSHLQLCVDRQILTVASDMADLMLSKNLPVEQTKLQMLLHKLGKQNLWLRAREVFAHSLSVGYYPGVSAPSGFMALIVPSELGEVELALSFEMFITVNATVILQQSDSSTSTLCITLKRCHSCEQEYLSAGSRVLSAACIPQPKLSVHYNAVNSHCEQVFSLDIPSARRWLQSNHLWASEVWTH